MMTTAMEPCCNAVEKTEYSLNYKLTTARIDGEDNLDYTTYGVTVTDANGHLVAEFFDISNNKHFVEGFIKLCQEKQVAPIHLADVLDDYLP